jgi:general L-amino acid transport system permease protein
MPNNDLFSAPDHQPVKPLNRRWFYDPKVRSFIYQVLAILAVAAFFLHITSNALDNLDARGITTGFSFLENPAGFGIIQSLIPYDETHSYGSTFLVGLLNTLLVSFIGVILATLLGFSIGVSRLSDNWLVAKISATYIEIFRNIPLLLQILFWYFAVLRSLPAPKQSVEFFQSIFINVRGIYIPKPIFESGFLLVIIAFIIAVVAAIAISIYNHRRQVATGQTIPTFTINTALIVLLPTLAYFVSGAPVGWDLPALRGFNFQGGIAIIPEFMALLLALTMYTAAFIAEIVRSGIESIDTGQKEAAAAIGLSQKLVLKLVVIPQALRVIIPPLTSQYLNLIKNSSLATAIGYPDLVSLFSGTTLNQTGQAIEIILMTMSVYLTISLLVSLLMNWFNNRIALVER